MSDNFTNFNEVKEDVNDRMNKSVHSLQTEFSGLRAGRAHSSLLDNIVVDAYGMSTPLTQVGTITTPDPRTISVSVWDKGLAKAVEKAIMESPLGFNPLVDGQLIRVPVPPLSEERRAELVKVASKYTEQGKIAIRNIRRDGMDNIKKMKKDNLISEDEEKQYEGEIQKLTDAAVKEIDALFVEKEKDIMQV